MSDLLSIYKELQAKKWVDLSHQINGKSTLPSPSCFATRRSFHIKRWLPCSKKFTVVGQYGTHIDAPIHFVEGVVGWMRLTSKIFSTTLCYRQV